MAAHTYWRLYIGAMSNVYAQMGTVSFLDAAQVNQSTGGTATASSEYDGSSWVAGNAFDGNPTSEWASAGVSSSEWIAYQHPSPVDIAFVGVKVATTYPVSGLALQYSDDGVSWSAAFPLYLLAGQPALDSGSYTVLGMSASRRPLVVVNGQLKELPEGDTLPPQTPATHSHATSDVTGLDAALDAKQDALVSGTNIKTVGGQSLLGFGDVTLNEVIYGASDPDNGGGNDGDVYIQSNGKLWKKDFNVWIYTGIQFAAQTAAVLLAGAQTVAGVKTFSDRSVHAGAYTPSAQPAHSATPTFDCATSNVFEPATMTGNVTSITLSNAVAGQTVQIRFQQDATGGRTVAVPSGAKVDGSINTGANRVSWLILTYSARGSRWEGNWLVIPL